MAPPSEAVRTCGRPSAEISCDASWKAALNEVVCHYSVDYILSSTLGHVTGDAIVGIRMLARADQGGKGRFMTASALAGIIPGGFLAAG